MSGANLNDGLANGLGANVNGGRASEASGSAILSQAQVDDAVREALRQEIQIIVDQEASKTEHSYSSVPTIFRVPDQVRNSNPRAYTPRRISMGPLHKPTDGRPDRMLEYKTSYMYSLFTQAAKASKTDGKEVAIQCTDAMLPMVGRIRACYGTQEDVAFISDQDLARMMVIDGCFILQFLFRLNYGPKEGDFMLENRLVTREVVDDLVMIENQIPFFVLKRLFSLTLAHISSCLPFNDLVFSIVAHLPLRFIPELKRSTSVRYDHILGFLQHQCFQPTDPWKKQRKEYKNYTATTLARAGVTFVANERSCDVTLATTSRTARLKIPKMNISARFEILLRNLTAYEMFSRVTHKYVKSYADLMKSLMSTDGDVQMLETSEVLTNRLASREDVRMLFVSLHQGLGVAEFTHTALVEQLDEYCNQFWPRLKLSLTGRMKETQSNLLLVTSWKTAAVVGAVLLFVLTLLQTIYTIRSA